MMATQSGERPHAYARADLLWAWDLEIDQPGSQGCAGS